MYVLFRNYVLNSEAVKDLLSCIVLLRKYITFLNFEHVYNREHRHCQSVLVYSFQCGTHPTYSTHVYDHSSLSRASLFRICHFQAIKNLYMKFARSRYNIHGFVKLAQCHIRWKEPGCSDHRSQAHAHMHAHTYCVSVPDSRPLDQGHARAE